MNNVVFWDVTPCDSHKNACLFAACFSCYVTADVASSSPMMEAIRFSEASVLRRATSRNMPANGILQGNVDLHILCPIV
jgi:hypothetical protein